jgi:predicted RNase H-like HicB family nuclease
MEALTNIRDAINKCIPAIEEQIRGKDVRE